MADRETYVNRVNKLLALAMDPSASEHEREQAQLRADALMIQHTIERSELIAAQGNSGKREEPTREEWDLNLSTEFSYAIRDLLGAVVRHTNCRAVIRSVRGKVPVVGFPEDISYAQTLWMVVFSELSRHMYPRWDDSATFDENVYNFCRAGTKWTDIHDIAHKHGAGDLPEPYPNGPYGKHATDGGRLKRAYRRELTRRGEEITSHVTRKTAYRESYVRSFSITINARLRRMRDESRKSAEQATSADRYALALRSTEQQVDDAFYLLYPEMHPDAIRKAGAEALEAERARRAALTPEEREKEDREYAAWVRRSNKMYDKMQDRSYDSAGWSRGARVAEKVDLAGGKRFDTQKSAALES